MKRFLKTKLARVLILVLIGVLLVGGGAALAYTTIWSSTASITIVVPDPDPGNGGGGGPPPDPDPDPDPILPLTAEEPTATAGVIEGGIWTVTILQGETEILSTYVNNPRDTEAWVELFTNGSGVNSVTVAPGVTVSHRIGQGFVNSLGPNSSLIVEFIVNVDETAEAGTLPDILLEIRERED